MWLTATTDAQIVLFVACALLFSFRNVYLKFFSTSCFREQDFQHDEELAKFIARLLKNKPTINSSTDIAGLVLKPSSCLRFASRFLSPCINFSYANSSYGLVAASSFSKSLL